MTVLQTLLTFVGIPVAVYLILAALVYGPSSRSKKRYRPGREYDFAPVWFLARPQDVSVAGAAAYVAEQDESTAPKELESTASTTRGGAKGGASGNW